MVTKISALDKLTLIKAIIDDEPVIANVVFRNGKIYESDNRYLALICNSFDQSMFVSLGDEDEEEREINNKISAASEDGPIKEILIGLQISIQNEYWNSAKALAEAVILICQEKLDEEEQQAKRIRELES